MTFCRQSVITTARNLGIYRSINNCYIKYLKATCINLIVYVQNSQCHIKKTFTLDCTTIIKYEIMHTKKRKEINGFVLTC